MFVASYRATERGAQQALASRLAEANQKRIEAQNVAWRAVQDLAAEKAKQKRDHLTLVHTRNAELVAKGVKYRPTYRSIEARACRVFKVTQAELRSNRRPREIVIARQFIMYWATRLTGLSLPAVGRLMGGRDHTTVLHGKTVYPQKRAKMGRHLREAR